MIRRAFIALNNACVRLRAPRHPAANLLLLLPHCLQRSGCPQSVTQETGRCTRCGGCGLTDLLSLCDELGVACCVASGGRQALQAVRRPAVRAVVAVACEKELCEGIRAAFPRPVLAVPNAQPHGPCHDTCVDAARVRAALTSLMAPASAVQQPAADAAGGAH